MEKALQLMNIKLSVAVSDISGVSGMAIIKAIVRGERDPVVLTTLRNKQCKKPEKVFIDALSGNFQEDHLFGLKQALDHYEFSLKQLEECDKMVEKELESYPDVVNTPVPERDKDKKNRKGTGVRKVKKKASNSFDIREVLWRKRGIDLTAVPGVEAYTALLIFAELGGADVSAWSTEKEFASWLKLCPGNNISGGKRRKSKRQPSTNYVAQALRMSALSAKKSKSHIGAHIRRICGKTDKLKGIKAGAHKLSHILYGMCKEGWQFHEKGEDYYEEKQREQMLKNLTKKARANGYKLVPILNAA